MQDHNKVQDSMNSNQNNVNGQCLDDGITSFANDVLIECNANENLFERNSVRFHILDNSNLHSFTE